MKLLFLLLAGLKWGKLATVGGSMLVSLGVYALVWGWRYAAGFLLLLLVHEMGHYLAACRRGLDVGAPTFIPFVGAWIQLKSQPMDVETEAYVAYAGPLLGSMGAFATYFLAREQNSNLLLSISYAGFFLNFFNLLPLSPLDGGRITAILSPRVWLVGAPIMVALFFYRPSPILIMIAFLSFPQLVKAWKYDPQSPENVAYYGVPMQTKVEYGALYLGLAALLGVMTYNVHEMLGAMHGG